MGEGVVDGASGSEHLLFVRGLHDEIVRLQLGLPMLDACRRQDASSLRTRVGGSFGSVGGRALPPIASLGTDRLRLGSIATGHRALSGTGSLDDLVALRSALGFKPRGELAWRTRCSRPAGLPRACSRPSPARRTRRSRDRCTWPPSPGARRAPGRRASRDVVQQPDAVGRADLDHREEVRRVVVDGHRHGGVAAFRVVAPLLRHPVLERHAPLDRLAEQAPELAPSLLPDLGLERPLDLEQVDGRAVLGREDLGGQDGEPGERERARDPREQSRPVAPRPRAVRMSPDAAPGSASCSHVVAAEVRRDRRVVCGDLRRGQRRGSSSAASA